MAKAHWSLSDSKARHLPCTKPGLRVESVEGRGQIPSRPWNLSPRGGMKGGAHGSGWWAVKQEGWRKRDDSDTVSQLMGPLLGLPHGRGWGEVLGEEATSG